MFGEFYGCHWAVCTAQGARETAIRFGVKQPCRVALVLFDLLGRKVTTMIDENYQPGYYLVDFNADMLPSGVYFYRIRMADFVDVKKMILLIIEKYCPESMGKTKQLTLNPFKI